MKQTDGFCLKYIDGIPYLLPFGQRIAEHRRSIQLNETSAFVWEHLPEASTWEELHTRMCSHWEASVPGEIEELKQDLFLTLQQFQAFGLCEWEEPKAASSSTCFSCFIGGAVIQIDGAPVALSHLLADFMTDEGKEFDMQIRIFPSNGLSTSSINPEILIEDSELRILQHQHYQRIQFPNFKQIVEVRTCFHGAKSEIYCLPPFDESLANELFQAIRLIFSQFMQTRGKLLLHSASLLYEGKAWLFSGSSGTGKSTHTNLWHSLFGTKRLNGDLNLLAWEENTPVIQGIPWCGTSQICDKGSYPLGGIVLLKQDKDNFLTPLTHAEQVLGIWQRIISPSDSEDSLCQNLDVIEKLLSHIPVVCLHCTKEPQAAIYMKEQIDKHHFI